MQVLVGADPNPAADERQPPRGPVYEAGARPDLTPRRVTPDSFAAASTLLVVLATTAFVIWQLHPMTLLFTNTMDAGGDNAGHISAPYYLIHQLLVHGQVSGWDPNWFDGFPLYVFYFPLPALLVAVFNLVMPYAVAFKLVTVSGTVLIPGAAYLFGRLAGFRRPVPALMSAAVLPFLWNTSYTIDGGNIASTMAGEFSFTLSMAFGMVFLGLVVNGLRTGRYRGLAALMFACTILCHVVPGLFFAFAAVVFTVATRDWRRLRFLVPTGITGGLLAGFWLVPFGAYLQYSSSMGYSRVTTIGSELFPTSYAWVLVLALAGCFAAVLLREGKAIALGSLAGFSALAFWLLPSGQVYNERWLPFWFLAASLMAGYGFGQIVSWLGTLLEFERWRESVGALLGSAAALVVVGYPVGALGWFGLGATPTSFVPGWISWNYTGFQAKPGWNVFEGIVQMLDQESAVYGCGRLEYEYTGPQLTGQFGSTMAFMSLPMWTNSCIDTTEGLYFESSTTTPFHFLDEAQVSTTPSDPVVGIPYSSYDVADGIRHLQMMGVRYLLAGTVTTQSYAAKDPSLQYLASTPGVPSQGTSTTGKAIVIPSTWKLYLIKDSPLVSPLSYEPVVEDAAGTNWQNIGIEWYQDEGYWQVPIVRTGPASWERETPGTMVPTQRAVAVQPTTVSNINLTDESISFDVSTVGVPVVVKIPYFPNWRVTGADGPYESTPNLMVVVPTSHHVTLTYGTSNADWAGYAASGVGVGLVVTYSFLPPVNFDRRRRRGGDTIEAEGDGDDGLGLDGMPPTDAGPQPDADLHTGLEPQAADPDASDPDAGDPDAGDPAGPATQPVAVVAADGLDGQAPNGRADGTNSGESRPEASPFRLDMSAFRLDTSAFGNFAGTGPHPQDHRDAAQAPPVHDAGEVDGDDETEAPEETP